MIKTVEDAKLVRLNESTDAGEFLCQNLSHLPGARPPRDGAYSQAMDAICADEPKPEDLAAACTVEQLTRTLNGLGQWGMSFESNESDLDTSSQELAEAGVSSAEEFVRAAIVIRRSIDEEKGS